MVKSNLNNIVSAEDQKGKKSKIVTYLLWSFFGFFGAHHLYLRRDRQAFLTFALFGGYLGFGLFRDFFWIPTYVKDFNDEPTFLKELKEIKKKNPKKPPWRVLETIVEMMVGNSFAFVFLSAIPKEEIFGVNLKWLQILFPLAAALGVHTVGNIGRQEGGMLWPTIGAYACYTLSFFIDIETTLIWWTVAVATILFELKAKKWRQKKEPRKPLLKRILIFSACIIIYLSLLTSYIYFNAEITYNNGETVKARVAIKNFFDSPLYNQLKISLEQLRNTIRVKGWYSVLEELIEKMDLDGEQNALKVLDLKSDATQEQITSRYRELSRKWHPDRHKDPEKKLEAQEQFMIIQQAYERLSAMKGRRQKKSFRTEL